MSYFRVNERCNGCLSCVHNCPADALDYVHREGHRIILHNIISCARCGNCWRICPEDAIEFQFLLRGGWDEVTSLKCQTCSVCGELIFTVDHKKTLKEKHKEEVEALCDRHKCQVRADSWIRAEKAGAKRSGMRP